MADVAGITALVNLPGVRYGTARLPFQSLEETRALMESTPPGSLMLAAELDQQIVGQGSLIRMRGRQAHMAELGIAVHDDFTGKGIGTALLDAMLDAADRWLGVRRTQLYVNADNAQAIALYERHGFALEGTHRAYALRDGAYVDVLCMARFGGADPLADLR